VNGERRKLIRSVIELLNEAGPKLDDAKRIVETAAEGEREYYDNMHDNLKGGEKGEQAESAATALEEVQSALEELDIEDLVSKLEEALG
jgi:hypothetical protein